MRFTEIEADRGPVGLKYQVARRILAGRTFDRGASPFQGFRELFSLRDMLVHLRPRDQVDPSGFVVPSDRLIRNFQQRNLTRSPAPGPGAVPGGMSWLLQIETDKMATWAYEAACKMIEALGAIVPVDELRTPAVSFMKRQTQEMPP